MWMMHSTKKYEETYEEKKWMDLEIKKESGTVLSQKEIAPGIFDMWIGTSMAMAAQARPGQFISLYSTRESMLLPRPISICEADREMGRLRIVYRVAGKGTKEFSQYRPGDKLPVMGTLGNGFPIHEARGKDVILMGGGIGIPPILQLAKDLDMGMPIIAGYRDSHMFLQKDLEKYGTFYAATEDGSAGIRGNVLDAVRELELKADVIYACGPMPMLRALKQYALEKGIKAYISLEERMACGVGACLGCVCKTVKTDGHSHVKNARVCTDGPVFEVREVDI